MSNVKSLLVVFACPDAKVDNLDKTMTNMGEER